MGSRKTTTSSTLIEPRILVLPSAPDDGLECSLHTLPKPLYREFEHVFGEKLKQAVSTERLGDDLQLLAIPTNQHALEDLVAVGDHIEREKDRLLKNFVNFSRDFCGRLRGKGYGADFIDPCSGLPMLTLDCNKVYSEVDGMECLLNYKSYNAGFCKILTHPKWGSAVYPATIFACCPVNVAAEMLQSYPSAISDP